MDTLEIVRQKYHALCEQLDERSRRLWAGVEARALGRGGISLVSSATGMSRSTVRAGLRELSPARPSAARGRPLATPLERRVRRLGGGRKPNVSKDATLLRDLEVIVDPMTRGDPQSALRWTCKGVRKLSEELEKQGHDSSPTTVRRLLKHLHYNLHVNRKTREGSSNKDRNAQFEYINARTKIFQSQHQPVISVDAKKTEKIGDFKNAGSEWAPEGHIENARVYDFVDKELGKAIPYGVYDVGENKGWVNVGTDHNTPQFAVESIRRWWQRMGSEMYPNATALLIMADGGSSNGYRCKFWKIGLQELANETGLKISVSHFPPGTSKWNKIEHRMFCHITMNWRAKPLVSHSVVVELIGATRTSKGLSVEAALDEGKYPTGLEASERQLQDLQLKPAAFHGEWNYTIEPIRAKA